MTERKIHEYNPNVKYPQWSLVQVKGHLFQLKFYDKVGNPHWKLIDTKIDEKEPKAKMKTPWDKM